MSEAALVAAPLVAGPDTRPQLQTCSAPLSAFERRRVTLIWILLFASSLPWSGESRVVFVPKRFEQLGTALALGAAFILALALNRRLRIRGAAPVFLYYLLPLVALLPAATGRSGLGSLFRTGRFSLALFVLLLLSPFWSRDRWVLLGAHLRALKLILASVAIGLPLGTFDSEGRLIGNLPALTAPAVGQYSALVVGFMALLLLQEHISRRGAYAWMSLGVLFLLMSNTRTAMVGLVVGLFLAVVSLVSTSRRARLVLASLLLIGPLAVIGLSSAADSWFKRGQTEEGLTTLTGRTKAWAKVYDYPRDDYTELFGVGLTDKSIDGLPIDSGYLAVYHEQGRVGLVVIGVLYAYLLIRILLFRPGLARALALFLLGYSAVASYTETGIGDMSSYVMHLVLAGVLVLSLGAPSALPAIAEPDTKA